MKQLITTFHLLSLILGLMVGTATAAFALPPCDLEAETGNSNYVWFKKTAAGFEEIPNETSSIFTTNAAGVYCASYDNTNTGFRDTSNLFIVICDDGDPQFQTARFDVSNAFTQPVTFQWFEGEIGNRTPINGETTGMYASSMTGIYSVDIDDGTCVVTAGPFEVCVTSCNQQLCVAPKVLLEGAIVPGDTFMTSLLTTPQQNDGCLDEFPLTQPYDIQPWEYTGTETASSGVITPDIVDWVLMEARNTVDFDSTFFRRALLVDKFGHAYTETGDSSVCINLDGGQDSVHIVIRHRNHLPIMSADPITEASNTPITVDFRKMQSIIRNSSTGQEILDAQYAGNVTAYAMVAGNSLQLYDPFLDVEHEQDINGSDGSVIAARFSESGVYAQEDNDFNCDITGFDQTIVRGNFSKSTVIDNF